MAMVLAQTCKQCGYKPDAWVNACPQCASVFESPERVRRMGWMSAFAGGFLVVMMSATLVMLGPILAGPTAPGVEPLSPAFIGRLYFMMGLIMLLGIIGVVSGVWQVRNGTRNRALVITMLTLVFVFFGAMISTVTIIPQP